MQTYEINKPYLNLHAVITNRSAQITVTFIHTPLTTKPLVNLVEILDQSIPTIFQNRCFNDDHSTFREEVRSTEIGHFFEHLLMEMMCLHHETISSSAINIKGLTTWNWYEYPPGTFNISLKSHQLDPQSFIVTLYETLKLFENILNAHKCNYLPTATPLEQNLAL